MQRLLKDICDEEYYREQTSVIGNLRRQTNLIESMGCKCPTVADTRWLSADVVTDWLSVNRGTLIEHYSKKGTIPKKALFQKARASEAVEKVVAHYNDSIAYLARR
jgi:hypothetical protein